MDVKLRVYEAFERLVDNTPLLQTLIIFDLLWSHFQKYRDDDVRKPPFQHQMWLIHSSAGVPSLSEPFPVLLRVFLHCIRCLNERVEDLDEYDLRRLRDADKLIKDTIQRFSVMDCEDFEFDKQSEFSMSKNTGQGNAMMLDLILSNYEVIIEHIYISGTSLANAEAIKGLFARLLVLRDMNKDSKRIPRSSYWSMSTLVGILRQLEAGSTPFGTCLKTEADLRKHIWTTLVGKSKADKGIDPSAFELAKQCITQMQSPMFDVKSDWTVYMFQLLVCVFDTADSYSKQRCLGVLSSVFGAEGDAEVAQKIYEFQSTIFSETFKHYVKEAVRVLIPLSQCCLKSFETKEARTIYAEWATSAMRSIDFPDASYVKSILSIIHRNETWTGSWETVYFHGFNFRDAHYMCSQLNWRMLLKDSLGSLKMEKRKLKTKVVLFLYLWFRKRLLRQLCRQSSRSWTCSLKKSSGPFRF